MSRSLAFLNCVLTISLLAAGAASAQSVHNVSSISQLQTAINHAVPGDQIILKNGSYTTSRPITVARAGTANQRIIIAAQSTGGATISGSAGFDLMSTAAFVVIRGFRFTHSGPLRLEVGSHNCLVTRNLFQIAGSGRYLWGFGNDHEISFNTFQNKTTAGQFLTMDDNISSSHPSHNVTQRPFIHHNYFHNHLFTGGNGGESLQCFSPFMRAESNLFDTTNGDPEVVSAKCSNATIRFNTFRNSTRGQLTLRFSRNDDVEGNFFISAPGIRAYGPGHMIRNNYLENSNLLVGDGASSGVYLQVDNVEISFNTFVNGRVTGQVGGVHDLPPQRVTFANNIMQTASGTLVAQPDPWLSSTYEGNIFFGGAAAGAVPASGFRTANPMLARDANGIFHIQASSPAINASAGVFSITTDMDGQSRDTATDHKPPDVGADEFSSAPVTHKALTAADVGPNAH